MYSMPENWFETIEWSKYFVLLCPPQWNGKFILPRIQEEKQNLKDHRMNDLIGLLISKKKSCQYA